jgi:hypothetical protein
MGHHVYRTLHTTAVTDDSQIASLKIAPDVSK